MSEIQRCARCGHQKELHTQECTGERTCRCESYLAPPVEDLRAKVAALEAEKDKALAANERDRTTLHQVLRQIDAEITGRMWLIEGRGAYEWDDDRYRREFGWAVNALQEKLEALRRIASDLTDSPTTQEAVIAARAQRGV